MTRLEKFDHFNRRISGWIEWAGFIAIFLMVVLTCVDVIGAKLFQTPVFGALDIMMLAQLIAISFAIAMALIRGRHIHVEFFVILLPRRLRAIVECFVRFLGLVLFVLIVWHLFLYGYYLQAGAEETPTAGIELYPFVYAAAAAFIPVCLVFLQQLISSILSVVKK